MDIWKVRVPSTLHVWFDTKPSSSLCDIGEHDCVGQNSEVRLKCASCHIVIHEKCLQSGQMNFTNKCKESYVINDNEFAAHEAPQHRHQFEIRLKSKGKCNTCKKTFNRSFSGRKVYVMQCLWCKVEIHSTCFNLQNKAEYCNIPDYVIPPSWIRKKVLKLPTRNLDIEDLKHCPFQICRGTCDKIPILMFINKKSGGGQYEKLFKQALWMLNPRQVVDLSIVSPKFGIHLFKDLQNCIFVVAGGDGTVGWILSTVTEIGLPSVIPIAIIPLGTGNDLARSFNWGAGYTTESLDDILGDVITSPVRKLDRWSLTFISDNSTSKEFPVMNNYFSIGADARIALEFHESRNANPDKFNSRFWNKVYYAGVGGKDVIMQSCRDMSEFCYLKCDDHDFTRKIVEKKISTLLFLNIDSYSGGKNPWGNPNNSSFKPQSCSDGLVEVIGFTYCSLISTQLGGSGYRLCQCRKADITLLRDMPVQVDGEPCILSAGHILIRLHGQVNILMRNHSRNSPRVNTFSKMESSDLNTLKASFYRIDSRPNSFKDKDSFIAAAKYCGNVTVCASDTVSQARKLINNCEWKREMTMWSFVKFDSKDDIVVSKLEEEDSLFVSDWLINSDLYVVF